MYHIQFSSIANDKNYQSVNYNRWAIDKTHVVENHKTTSK